MAVVDATTPLRGPDIEGMKRTDWIGQMLTDEVIVARVGESYPGIDTDAVVVAITYGPIPDHAATVGEWIDSAAEHVVAEEDLR